MSKSSLEAAAEAAAKVNAMLIAKGKLLPYHVKPKVGNNILGRVKNNLGDLIIAEVDINDAPLSARNLLTRGLLQDDICRVSGAAISTRGRYMTPEERQTIATPESRPLYLNIQASNHAAIKAAIDRIHEIIDQHFTLSGLVKSPTAGVVTYPTTVSNGLVNSAALTFQNNHLPSGAYFVQDKVFIGLEQAPSEYPVREKILGPGESFLHHIRVETGATVTLRGKGSGFIEPTSGREAFEPLYIHITHPKAEGLQAAKVLAINLVETAHVEFAQWQQTQQQSVLQPLTSMVLPQATSVAYQNQVVVTPTVLSTSMPVSAGVVAAGIRIPTSVATPGAALATGIPNLVHASIPAIVTPVSVVSSVPVSVQAVPSNTVITYPTLVANTAPILTRAAAPAVSLFNVVPATSPAAVFPASAPPRPNPLQPLVYASVQTAQNSLAQSSVPGGTMVALNQPLNYPISSRYSQQAVISPHTSAQQYYRSVNIPFSTAVNVPKRNCLQESSNVTPRNTEAAAQWTKRPMDGQDRDLMPPPNKAFSKMSHSITWDRNGSSSSAKHDGPPVKRLKGALVGLASTYGSDSDDDADS